jgi:chemotaxis protein MotA
MNLNSVIGYLIAFFVFYFGIYKGAANPELFLDSSSIIIVCGGTIATMFMIFPISKLINLMDFFFFKVVFKTRRKDIDVAISILDFFFDENVKNNIGNKKDRFHPFLVEAIYMIRNNNFTANELNGILSERIANVKKTYSEDSKMLTTLAKFPPAFGLLGSVTGIISMMMGLGEGGADKIGPAMAVTLVTTFWGIAIANLILLPLADHAIKSVEEEVHTRQMIKAAVLSIYLKNERRFLFETLTSFVTLKERPELKVFYNEYKPQQERPTEPPQRKSS